MQGVVERLHPGFYIGPTECFDWGGGSLQGGCLCIPPPPPMGVCGNGGGVVVQMGGGAGADTGFFWGVIGNPPYGCLQFVFAC